MKKLHVLFLCLVLFFNTVPLWAVPGAGISPCTTTPLTMTVTGSSSNFKLSACGDTLIVFNNSSVDAFFVLGASSSTVATTGGNIVPAKTFVVLNVSTAQLYFAAITGGGSATLSFIQGMAAS